MQARPDMQIGTDILSIKRLKIVFDRFKDKLVNKILSESEIKFYHTISNERRRLEFLGGRFCGKEAIFKASADSEKLTWKLVSILKNDRNKSSVFINGKECKNIKISISHEEEFATATAINSNDGDGDGNCDGINNSIGNRP